MMPDPQLSSLKALKPAVDGCRRCPLYAHATQGVPGEGPRHARLMLMGEQPGNDEDLAGHPFVGPAGQMLDKALADAGIARDQVFVTNAVKHFKFEIRGKRRLHKRPNAQEIAACKVWIDNERKLVKPKLTVALGATAARSLTGKSVTIASLRGRIAPLPDGGDFLVTIHPSFLLRMPDRTKAHHEYEKFVADLAIAQRHIAKD